jgi:hypothetical protein
MDNGQSTHGFASPSRPTNACVARRATHASDWSSARSENILLLFSPSVHSCAVPPGKRGGSRSSRNAPWDAMAAMARLTSVTCCGRRSRVVLAPRCWRQVGGRLSCRRRWQESRSPVPKNCLAAVNSIRAGFRNEAVRVHHPWVTTCRRPDACSNRRPLRLPAASVGRHQGLASTGAESLREVWTS